MWTGGEERDDLKGKRGNLTWRENKQGSMPRGDLLAPATRGRREKGSQTSQNFGKKGS